MPGGVSGKRRMIGRLVILKTLVLATLLSVPASGQYFSQPPRQQAMPSGVSAASYAAGAWAEAEPTGPVIHERMLSRDRGWGYQDTNLDRLLRVLVRNTWIRWEYMNFESKRPGDHLLGADNPMVNNERMPFTVSSGGNPIGVATVPALDSILLNNVNGMRGTLGVMLSDGALELNVWGLSENDSTLSMSGLGAQAFGANTGGAADPVFAATTTMLNGLPGNNQFLYDHSFEARYVQDVWGTGINYIANDPDVGPGLKLMPIVGFRYLEVTEGLFQTGVFNGGFDGVVDFGEDLNSNGMLDTGEDINNDGLLDLGLVSTIDSRVNNEIYAPQIGFRLQFEHEWFHLGFEPKLAVGVNRYEMAVETNQLRSFGDPRTHDSRRGSRFAQVADFRFFVKLFPSDNLELFFAYDITVAGGLSRAHDNVYYNDNGQSEPPAIGVDPGFETVWWQGLTVGGQIWLR
jgi:hypothetical protein